MMPYRLSGQAEEDLIDISLYGFSMFGVRQARRYHAALEHVLDLIADNPGIGRRMENQPRLRRFHHGRHFIVYSEQHDHVLIERVLHESMELNSRL